jgi:ABC-2 type transport system permease protein
LPGIGALSLLAIVLVGGAGILVSLRAATVRQAQQMLNLGLLGAGLLTGMAIAALPEGLRDRLRDLLTSSSTTELVLAGGATLLIVDAILLAAAVARFRRSRLVLD